MARCVLREVEEEGGAVVVKIDSPISKNMRTTLREEDIKRELPHSTGLSAGAIAALLRAKIGKEIEISNFNSPEKVRKGDRKMKATITLEESGFDGYAFVGEAIEKFPEEITGYPKKYGGTSLEMPISNFGTNPSKPDKKKLHEFLGKLKELIVAHGGVVKEITLADK